MWTDNYCYEEQCGAVGVDEAVGSDPPGAPLFNPTYDKEFGDSVGGMIWPRGFVAAAAFWNFDASLNPASAAFVAGINKLNDELRSRGSWTCPNNCSCDELTQCGKPYIKPTPPATGATLSMASCVEPDTEVCGQAFALSTDGRIHLMANTSLCVASGGNDAYPPVLADCDHANKWSHNASNAMIVDASSGQCLDLRGDDGFVGTWDCGSKEGLSQPNQHWGLDAATGKIVSMADDGKFGGQCVTASSEGGEK